MDPRVTASLSYLYDNFDQPISCVELANRVNLSVSRLRHLIKAETGLSPKQFIKKIRLEKARDLLEQTFLNVKEIAAAAGFADCSHFVRDFEIAFGLTPVKYRNHVHLNLHKIVVNDKPDSLE